MGYDDNTPLTGVTGAGLPAEIWRETMLRIHEEMPPRPLPLQEPINAANAQNDRGQGSTGSGIDRLLRDIFGGGEGRDRSEQPER